MKETIKKVLYENLDSVFGIGLLFLILVLSNINSISSLYVYGIIILPVILIFTVQKIVVKHKKTTKEKRFKKEKHL